jgi:hypothetical protein
MSDGQRVINIHPAAEVEGEVHDGRQRVLVMYVDRRDHGRCVRQPRWAVHANVYLHAEVPLLAFAGLMHLGIALLVGVLGRAGRADDRGVYDRAGTHLQAAHP